MMMSCSDVYEWEHNSAIKPGTGQADTFGDGYRQARREAMLWIGRYMAGKELAQSRCAESDRERDAAVARANTLDKKLDAALARCATLEAAIRERDERLDMMARTPLVGARWEEKP